MDALEDTFRTPHATLEDPRAAYLSRATKVELLVDRWYAWPHLLAPAQQAMNLAFRYLPFARSFVSAPAIHVAAANDPAMFGGPFMDLPVSAAAEVREYVARTTSTRARALQFAEAFRDFDARLQSSANGFSLDELYPHVPPALRGLVNLVYDLNDHPKLRILEEMMAEDDLGHVAAQEIFLHREPDTDRTFFLSTPRLPSHGGQFVGAPFASDAVRALIEARNRPLDLLELSDQLKLPLEALSGWFTNERPTMHAQAYDGPGVRIRYFGHACLLIETADCSILVDPTAAWERHDGLRHLTFEDLPETIDYLFLSHGHQDHLSPEMLAQIRDRVRTVLIPPHNRGELSDPSLHRLLTCLGYRSIRSLEPLESIALPDGVLTALPFTGEHCDLDIHAKQCAVVELRGRKICLFVDSDAIDPEVYNRLLPRLSSPDVMFVGMECFGAPLSWLYGPLLTAAKSKRNDGSRRLSGANCERAWTLAEKLKPAHAYVYAMGQEPWMRYLMGLNYTEDSVQITESGAFVERCRSAGIVAERLYGHMELEL
jgi:L-ascorbate metabolism protein UlaG (beta-lactamase superfamily)